MVGFRRQANGFSWARLAFRPCYAIVQPMPTLRRLPPPAGPVAMLICAALLASCRPTGPEEAPTDTILNNIAEELPTLPAVEAPLDRERLMLATIRAASAFAAGADDSAAQRELDGKRFELRIRFGCGPADSQDESRGWRFDETKRTLRLRLTPDISAEDPVAAAIAAEEFEGVEGLWLHRPWLLTSACPRTPPPAPGQVDESESVPDQPPEESAGSAVWKVGIAQFFSATDSRTARRRQRPYESTKVLDEGQRPSGQGYDFVVSGRIRALPDRRVIACAFNDTGAPPACIISVHVDRTWIERPDNRELLAEWRG
jgi:hypothetical protein